MGDGHELSFPLPAAPVFPPGAGSFSAGSGAAELRSAWPLYDCDAKNGVRLAPSAFSASRGRVGSA